MIAIERPALFSAPMMRANLRAVDPKTQTRRIAKVTPDQCEDIGLFYAENPCPYGQPGDRLYGREAWRVGKPHDKTKPIDILPPLLAAGKGVTVLYDAGGWKSIGPPGRTEPIYSNDEPMPDWAGKGRPSIHMPRAFSRLLLEIVSIRIERLQDISEADAKAEGCEPAPVPECCGMLSTNDHGILGSELHCCGNFDTDYTYKAGYELLWESINGAGSWVLNPWVWCITYRRLKP